MPVSSAGEPREAPGHATPRTPGLVPHDPLAAELVARTDELYVRLEAAAALEKRVREAARGVFRGVTRETAAGLANAIAVENAERDVANLLEHADAAARAWLAAHGLVASEAPEDLEKIERADSAPRGTIVKVLAPAWKTAAGVLVVKGEALVSSGPGSPLLRALERAERAARRLARRAEDVAARFIDLRADVDKLDSLAAIKRAVEAIRYVESLAAIHSAPGVDVAESGLADLAVWLEERGVHREPRERLEGAPDEPGTTESDHLRVRWVEDVSPAGTVIRRSKSAFVQRGALFDGEKGEVVASLGQRSEAERRLLDLARTLEPGSPLTRALVRFRKLHGKDPEGAARVLIEVLSELRGAPGSSDRTKRQNLEASAGLDRLLGSLGVERFDASELGPSTEIVAREPDPHPEGALVRTVEQGWKLRAAVLVKAKVAVSMGPRSALPVLLENALARALPDEIRALVAAARARAGGLTLEAAEGERGLACALDLASALPPGGDEATAEVRRELDAFLAARGLTAFPRDAAQARTELDRSAQHYDVERVRSESPRGDVVAILARGYRSTDGVVRKARVATSQGTGDPLARALVSLGEALGGTPVPELSPLARLASIARALEAPSAAPPSTGGKPGTGSVPAKDPLGEAASAARAAELLAATRPDVTEAVREVLERALLPALSACGVEPVPPFGADALAPSAAELVDADFQDSARPAGALLAVAKRGYVRAGTALARAHVVISRGPRPALLDVAEKIAKEGGPLADLAAELVRKADAARTELALGKTTEARARDQVLDAGVALLRAAERSSEDTTALRATLALLHDQVEIFPTDLAKLEGAELANDPAYEVETVFDDRVPPGTVMRLERAGVRDRRAGVARLERARVVVSLGRRPAVDHALDALVAALRGDPLSPPGAEDKVRAVRDAARGLVKDGGTPLEARLREALATSFAGLLDLIETRRPAVLDEQLLPALRALGVKTVPGPDDGDLERSSARVEVTREHSEAVAAGDVLRVVKRGVEVDGKVVRVAKVVVSLGPKDDTEVVADELEALIPRLPPAAREPLVRAVRAERATAAAVREGKTMPPSGARATTLVDAVNEALGSLGESERGLLLALRPALGRALARAGFELFPLGESLAEALLADPQAVEIEAADYAGGVRGTVISLGRIGVRRGTTIARSCRVKLDLGSKPTFLGDLEAAAAAGAATEPLVAQLRDPRRILPDDALALALFDLHEATEAARPALARALRALGAELFPSVGERAPDGVDAVRVYADEQPVDAVVRVAATGLRRGGRILRTAKAEVSRGPMSQAMKALAALPAGDPQVDALRAKLEALPAEKHLAEEGDRILAEALGVRVAPEVVAHLRGRGYVVAPEAPGGPFETLRTTLGGDHALEAPRRRFHAAPAGEIVAVERPAVAKGELVLAKARVVVSAGAASEVHTLVQEIRDKLAAESADAKSLAEVDDVLEKAADAKPDRMHFLVFPVMNVLHRLGAKDKHGAGLKAFLRAKHVREITAYAGYPAAELGPKKLEEVRVNSEREKGKIVKVLRPGFEEEKSGAILQKVQAEVSR